MKEIKHTFLSKLVTRAIGITIIVWLAYLIIKGITSIIGLF